MTQGELTDDRFWELIESHVQVNDDGSIDAGPLVDHLKTLTPGEIFGFHKTCTRHYAESRTWDLWGAASLIHDGAPDDTFDYFRSWLIGRGRAVYQAAVQNPDSLFEVATPEAIDDELYAAGQTVYEAVTGGDLPKHEIQWPDLGDKFDFHDADQMQRRYPNLATKFGDF